MHLFYVEFRDTNSPSLYYEEDKNINAFLKVYIKTINDCAEGKNLIA